MTEQPKLPDGSIIEVDGVYVDSFGNEYRCIGETVAIPVFKWAMECIDSGRLVSVKENGYFTNPSKGLDNCLLSRKKPKIVRWANIYKYSSEDSFHLHESADSAKAGRTIVETGQEAKQCIACIRIEFEEGQFDE